MSVVLMAFGVVSCAIHPPDRPEDFPTTVLEGTIRANGAPIDQGWISVFPMGPTVGVPAYARILAGRYRMDDAPVGSLQVRITLPRSQRDSLRGNSPLRYQLHEISRNASPLRVVTRAKQTTTFDFDILMTAIPSKAK